MQIMSEFWPLPIQHAVNLNNIITPRQDTSSPWEQFTNTDSPWNLCDMNTLFSPLDVLDR